MPREASITAKARLSHQNDEGSSPGYTNGDNSVPETQLGHGILPIPDYDLPGGPRYLNTSLPNNIHKVHLNPGTIVDPVLSGSHEADASAVLPTTSYQNFSQRLQVPKCPGMTAKGKKILKKV